MMECKKVFIEVNGDINVVVEVMCKFGVVKVDKKVDCVVVEGCLGLVQDGGKVVFVEVNLEIDFVVNDDNFKFFVNVVVVVVLVLGVIDVEVVKVVMLVDGCIVEEVCVIVVQILGENIQICCMVKVDIIGNIGVYVYINGKVGVLVDLIGGDVELVCGLVMYVVVLKLLYNKVVDVLVEFVEKEKEIELVKMIEKDKVKLVDILEKIISGKINKIVSDVILYGQIYVLGDIIVEQVVKVVGVDVVGFKLLIVGEGIEKVVEDYVVEVVKVMQV